MALLTRQEVIDRLRLKKAFFSKVVNGKVKGVPPPPTVRLGRRQLFREESIDQWIIELEANSATRLP